MKKITSLYLIVSAFLTNSTMFGMLLKQLKNHTKTFTTQQKKYNAGAEINLMQLMTILDRQNSLLEKQTASLKATNNLLDKLINNAEMHNNKTNNFIDTNNVRFESDKRHMAYYFSQQKEQ